MNREIIYPIVFCAAIVAANLLVGWLGPKATPFIAFFLIGLDLSLRDKIHEVWHGKGLIWKMSLLVIVAGAITYLMNQGAGRIAVASVAAFMGAMVADALVYERFFHHKTFYKMNYSNIVSAAVDTFLFITIAFGELMPAIMILQYLAKTVGGAFWAFIVTRYFMAERA